MRSLGTALFILLTASFASAVTSTEALQWGAANCRADIIADAFAQSADVKITDLIGDTPLHQALRAKCPLAIVKTLINHGAPVNATNVETAWQQTPLHLAAMYEVGNVIGDGDIIPALLAAGANPNLADTKKLTPIFYALSAPGTLFNFSTLLEAPGIDLQLVTSEGGILEYLFGKTTHHGRGDYWELTALLKKGALVTNDILYFLLKDVEKEGISNMSVEQIDLIKSVMATNPRQDAQDQLGQTALHHFCKWIPSISSYSESKFHQLDALLIGHLAPLNQQDKEGNTPLHSLIDVVGTQHVNGTLPSEWARLFIASGANLSLRNKAGETAVDLAKKHRLVDLEFILETAH